MAPICHTPLCIRDDQAIMHTVITKKKQRHSTVFYHEAPPSKS